MQAGRQVEPRLATLAAVEEVEPNAQVALSHSHSLIQERLLLLRRRRRRVQKLIVGEKAA